MSFSVQPHALRSYAEHLADAARAAEVAKKYVHQHGSFSLHDRGLLGMVAPGHRDLVAALDLLLGKLHDLTETSGAAIGQVAAHYEQADLRAEAALDATYPAVPRPPASRD